MITSMMNTKSILKRGYIAKEKKMKHDNLENSYGNKKNERKLCVMY